MSRVDRVDDDLYNMVRDMSKRTGVPKVKIYKQVAQNFKKTAKMPEFDGIINMYPWPMKVGMKRIR